MKNVNILSLQSVNTYFATTLIYELCKTPLCRFDLSRKDYFMKIDCTMNWYNLWWVLIKW